MPVITFWSAKEKSIGQTVSASVAATVTAIENNYKVLLISADFNDEMLETSFGAQESNKEIVKGLVQKVQMNLDSGIRGLLKLVDSNRITPEAIHDYTKIVFKNRLEILYSPININNDRDDSKFMEQIKTIIINASRYYDQVFVDLKKGLTTKEQLEILDMSDVVVVNIDQRLKTIEQLLSSEVITKMRNKVIWNICKNDKNSKYNAKNLLRRVLKNETICETDYNTLVWEATQEGGIPELMLRFRTVKENGDDLIFITKIKKMVEEILLRYRQTRAGI